MVRNHIEDVFSDPIAQTWLSRPLDKTISRRLITQEMLESSVCYSYELSTYTVSGLLVPFQKVTLPRRSVLLGFWINQGVSEMIKSLFGTFYPEPDQTSVSSTPEVSRFVLELETGRVHVAEWLGDSGHSLVSTHYHSPQVGRYEVDLSLAELASPGSAPSQMRAMMRLKRDCLACKVNQVACVCEREVRRVNFGMLRSYDNMDWAGFVQTLTRLNVEEDMFTIDCLDVERNALGARYRVPSKSHFSNPTPAFRLAIASFLLVASTPSPRQSAVKETVIPLIDVPDWIAELEEAAPPAPEHDPDHPSPEQSGEWSEGRDRFSEVARERDEAGEYPCRYCQRGFRQRAHTALHIAMVHHKAKPYVCEVCGFRFGSRSNLLRHDRTVHKKIPRPLSKRRRKPDGELPLEGDSHERRVSGTSEEHPTSGGSGDTAFNACL